MAVHPRVLKESECGHHGYIAGTEGCFVLQGEKNGFLVDSALHLGMFLRPLPSPSPTFGALQLMDFSVCLSDLFNKGEACFLISSICFSSHKCLVYLQANPNRGFGDHPGIILGHGSFFFWQGLGAAKEGMNIPSEETGIVSKNVLIRSIWGP